MNKGIRFTARFYLAGMAIIFFFSGLLTACRLEGDIEALRKNSAENPAVNPGQTDPEPEPVPSISAPGVPVVIASDGILTVRWPGVEEALRYEVYISTAEQPPSAPEKTVSVTTTVLDGLANKTIYYVWIKAVNEDGASGFSPRARGIPWPSYEAPATPERPVIIPGINQLTVNWEESGGAYYYEVYINTMPSAPYEPAVVTDKTSAVVNNLENDVVYYIWVRAVNNAGKSGYSPLEAGTPRIPTVPPAAPSRPVLTAGSREIVVSWQAVELAASYEVWFGTSDNSAQAQKYGGDVTGGITEAVINGLANEQTYYVWIKAKNIAGSSGFSISANAKPSAFLVLPETPEMPAVIPGNRELFVSWQSVEGTLFYEIWTGVTDNPANAEKHGADISGTSVTITGLDNGTMYYIWLRGKNNTGTGNFSATASGIPSVFDATPLAPLSVPSVSAGNAQLVISWLAVEGAISYEIWMGTTVNQTSAEKHGNDVPSPSGTITGLSNGTAYYIWIKAKNNIGTSGFSPEASGKPIANMGAVTLVPGNGQLTASWSTVAGAEQYEVYHNTINSIPASPAQTVSTTTATITNLTNGTTYYVWVKSKNTTGLGNASTVINGKPLGTPGLPTISSDYKQLLVSWTNVAGAEQYEVYYGTGTPTILAATTAGTTATITGLTGDATYYVRLRAKNSTGVSDYGPVASGVPSNVRSPGLYLGNNKIGTQNLSAALSYISTNAVSGYNYFIVLGRDESASMGLYYSGKTVGITLIGYGGERTITLNNRVVIDQGVTFTLDENISLIGLNTYKYSALVYVGSNGTLVMNDGAKISGNINSEAYAMQYDGGGVYVDSNGTFTMNGGTISGNTASGNGYGYGGGIHVASGGTFTMNGGIISENTAKNSGGGIVSNGTFIMNGGTISGNTASTNGGGIFSNGTVTMNGGTISGNTSGLGGGIIVGIYGTFTMQDGTISGNTASSSGGGINVASYGTLTMNGGTISGNTSNSNGGGIYVQPGGTFRKLPPNGGGQNSGIIYGSEAVGNDAEGIPLKNTDNGNGHAIYFDTPTGSVRRRSTTAGQTDYIDTTTDRGLSASGDAPYGQ